VLTPGARAQEILVTQPPPLSIVVVVVVVITFIGFSARRRASNRFNSPRPTLLFLSLFLSLTIGVRRNSSS
jgi:hypothetical protein